MNSSNTNSKEDEWTPTTTDYEIIVWCTLFILTAIAILCANIFAIVVFTTKRLLRKRSNILLMNLATADLMIGGIALPMFVCIFFKTLKDPQWQNIIVNEVYISVDIFAGLTSMLVLAVIALERAYSVFLPLKHRCMSRRSRFYWLSVAFAWTLAGTLTLLKILTKRGIVPPSYDNHIIFTFVSLALITILVAYVSIWTRIKSRKKNISYVIREKSVVQAMLIVTIFFIVMWFPFFLINVIASFDGKLLLVVPPNVIYAAKLMHYGNSVVNPIIYSLKLPHFRKALRKISIKSSVRTEVNDKQEPNR